MEVSTRSRKSHPCASSGISLYPSKAASAKDGPLALSCHPPASPLPSWPCEAAYLFRCEAQLRSSSFFAAYPLIPASLSDFIVLTASFSATAIKPLLIFQTQFKVISEKKPLRTSPAKARHSQVGISHHML